MLVFDNSKNDEVRPEEIEVGKIYNISDCFERGEYRGNLNTYFMEYVYRNNEMYFMTKEDGTKPFAIATNDCVRDGFDTFHLAKIFVEVGHNIVYAYKLKGDKSYDPIRFVIFQVTNLNTTDGSKTDAMEAKAIYKFTSIDPMPQKFDNAVQHAVEVIDCELEEQLIPKYCFNPNRLVTLRLFERNDKDEVVSYFGEGQKLIMNANSKARFTDERKVTNGGLFRVFFSKKFRNSSTTYVEGAQLTPLRKWDLEKYIQQSHLEESTAQSMIKQIVTHQGNVFYAIVNLSGQVRPIYKSTTDYLSFSLSDDELAFIKEVRDI